MEYKYPIRTNYVVLGSIPRIGIVSILLWYSTLKLIIWEFIDTDTCPRVMLKIFCEIYTNQTYMYYCPACLSKFVVRVLVGRS